MKILNNTYFRFIPVSLFFLLIFPVNAQDYFFDNYGVAEGLAQSKVYDILQNDDHFIWLGTQAGLSIFDGQQFDDKNEKDGLAPNGVRSLFKDSKGRIWLGHNGGGITLYNNEHFQKLSHPNLVINSDVLSIIEDREGNIWCTSFNSGAYKISNYSNTGQFEVEQYKGNSLSDIVFEVSMLSDGTLIFITDVGIKKYIEDSNAFESFHIEGLSLFFQFITIFEDSKNNLWFGTHNGGLYKYDIQNEKFTYFKKDNGLAEDWISCIYEDREGTIWVGTWEGGISCFNKNGTITNFNTSNGLQDDKIYSIVEDAEGNILIGTFENGLSVFKGFQFINYTKDHGLISNQVTAIEQDSPGNIWFGSNQGITKLNTKNLVYHHLSRPSYSISDNIEFILQDHQDKLWFGTGEGVFSYSGQTNNFNYNPIININLMPNEKKVYAMGIDKYNQLWIGSNYGLIKYNINQRQGTTFTQINGLCGNYINTLYIDKTDNIWVGFINKGVTRINQQTNEFKCFEQFSGMTPTAITQDAQGRMWIASESNDVLVLQNDSVVHRFGQNEGLLTTFVLLMEADNENVYLGTNRGLNIYNLKEDKIYTYTRKGGFTGIEAKPHASLVDKEGNVWFGTVNGAIRYNPKYEKNKDREPLTHIKSILVNKELRHLMPGEKLKHFESDITFNYYSVCLSDPSSVRYQYKLEPLEKDWQPVTTRTSVEYNPLSPGSYTFMVRACNNYGNWNSQPIVFPYLIIKKPFYQTIWFISVCILFGGILIFSYIKIREQNLIREKRILEETVQERTSELKEKKDQLEMYNKDITDSIHYAQRIQFAMLPPGPPFKDTFVFFRPKDIVSGDFYWFQQEEHMEFLSAVDCTGHGVPGAFMSFIGYNTLNKVVKEYGVFDPAKILESLNREVITTLRQEEKVDDYGHVKDGMDMALVSFNASNKKLEYAGAYNPLILIRNGEIIEKKADRVAIGHDAGTQYTKHAINIIKGDTIYLFSDGYADQFGGERRKKYKTAKLKRLFLSIQDKNMNEQLSIIEKEHDLWKGGIEQIDDILVIGRRF